MKRILIALALALAAHAQQFTWEGEVPGIVVLHVHGKKVDVEYRDGAPVARAKFRFATALPESRQTVRLEVRQSRGAVELIAQPGVENRYSADVLIEDRQDGAGFYSIALYWDASGAPSGRLDRLKWSGIVDGEVSVECRAAQCVTKVERGRAVGSPKFKFSRALPALETQAMLDETGGQAEIRLVEQPSERNGYTAKVSIRSLGGATPCSFVLSWERPGGK